MILDFFQQKLNLLFSFYGPDLWDNPAALRSYLQEACPQSEYNWLVCSVVVLSELRIPQKIHNKQSGRDDSKWIEKIIAEITQKCPLGEDAAAAAFFACLNTIGTNPLVNRNQYAKLTDAFLETLNHYDLESLISKAITGQQIFLKPGTYYISNTINIDKPLSIIGAGPDRTRICCNGARQILRYCHQGKLTLQKIAFYESSIAGEGGIVSVFNGFAELTNCWIVGNEVDRTAPSSSMGLEFVLSQGKIEKCHVVNISANGIFIGNNSNFEVSHSVFEANRGEGIKIFDSTIYMHNSLVCNNDSNGIKAKNVQGEIVSSKFTGNGFDGLRIEDSQELSITENVFRKNKNTGVFALGEGSLHIENNECSQNEWVGIFCHGSCIGMVRNNICMHNSYAGLGAAGDSMVMFVGNLCKENQVLGISLLQRANCKVAENYCVSNFDAGIGVGDEALPEIERNYCENNCGDGIRIWGQAKPQIDANFLRKNVGCGLAYLKMSAGMARGNYCDENHKDGIRVAAMATPFLLQNRCRRNLLNGIDYVGKVSGNANENYCQDNLVHGINIHHKSFPDINENVCSNNRYCGIAFSDVSAGTARKNECFGNGSNGIMARENSSPSVEQNECHQNGGFGILFSAFAKGRAIKNNCRKNGKGELYVAVGASTTLTGNSYGEKETKENKTE